MLIPHNTAACLKLSLKARQYSRAIYPDSFLISLRSTVYMAVRDGPIVIMPAQPIRNRTLRTIRSPVYPGYTFLYLS